MDKKSPTSYLPISDYGIIGNLHTCALVGINGSIDFMCLPRFDSATVFASLLDAEKGGCFRIDHHSKSVEHSQYYLPDSNILTTRYKCAGGIAELTDFMAVTEEGEHFRLYRRLTSITGNHQFKVRVSPRFGYGSRNAHLDYMGSRCVLKDPEGEQPELVLTSWLDWIVDDHSIYAEVDLEEGETVDFSLSLAFDHHVEETGIALENCLAYWHQWSSQNTYDGPWREFVHRSALTLKLLTSAQFGSTIAAATFGLPETLGGERNWDYRYTWIRDAAFTMYAFLRLGFREEAEKFVGWLEEAVCEDKLQLLYAIDGNKELEEQELDHLSGYQNSKPVRIGNGASDQTQMDIYGELIDTIYLFNQAGGSITYRFWKHLVDLVEFVIENWQTKGHGIWEVRAGKQRFLHSTVCCWVAVDRAIRIAEDRSLPAPIEKWRRSRDEIYHSIFEDFWSDELEAFVQYEGAERVDASALLMPLLRVVSSKEPKWLQTFEAVERDLRTDVFVYRYRQTEAGEVDGLKGEEGSFTICSFWYVECLARVGRLREARMDFEKLMSYANHLGLFSEEIGMAGRQLGNFPQAFSHLALISAAFQIDAQLRAQK